MTTPAAPRADTLGRVALGLAIAVTALMLVSRIFSVLAPLVSSRLHLPVGALGLIVEGIGGIAVVIALGAVVVGAVSLRRPDAPRGSAAAGLAVGATAIVIYIVGLLTATFLYGTLERM